MFILLFFLSWAGIYENVTSNINYYNGDIFNPSFMYNTTAYLEYRRYVTLEELEERKRSMFEHLRQGAYFIDRCYSNYQLIEARCVNNHILIYFQSIADQNILRALMEYNYIIKHALGMEIEEIKHTIEDPETNVTYTRYSYRWKVTPKDNLLCYMLMVIPLERIVLFPLELGITNICKTASSYYNRFLIDLSYILEYQNHKILLISEKLKSTYKQFELEGGCVYHSGICGRYVNITRELEDLNRSFNNLRFALELHPIYVTRSTNLYRIAADFEDSIKQLIRSTQEENEKLLFELSQINLSSYCRDHEIMYIDYVFDDGSPAENCNRAYLILSLISNTNIDDNKIFYLNQKLKTLKNRINEYLRLDKDAINKAKLAIETVRKSKIMELENTKYDGNTKRMLLNIINNNMGSLGKTYVFLKNLRFDEYRNYDNLYKRLNDLIKLAEKDDIDVSYEKNLLMTTTSFDLIELYMIEEMIYWKAKNRYKHLEQIRSNLIEMLNKLPISIAKKFRDELLRLEGPEGLVIEKLIGKLKVIENNYMTIMGKIEKEAIEYLKNYVDVSYHVTYPNKFYVDREESSYLLVKICNPFDIVLTDVKINANRIMKEFNMNSINIPKLYPNDCQLYEAHKKQILAKSKLVNLEAHLIDNRLTSKHKLIIESKIEGIAVYDYNEYQVKEGLNEFEIIKTTPVALYVKDKGNGTILLEWKYGEFPVISVKYAGLSPCKVDRTYYEFCNTSLNKVIELFNTTNTTEIIRKVQIEIENLEMNRAISYLNSSPINISFTNISFNITNKSQLIDNIEKKVIDKAKEAYNSIKNAFKTSDAKVYLNLLYHKAITGNDSALQELIKIRDNLGNNTINTSIFEKYQLDYIKDYFDLSPQKVNAEVETIKEMMIYNPEMAIQRYEQLKAQVLSQYDLVKDRLMMLADKYDKEDKTKIAQMLEQGKVKDAVNYMKNLKPVSNNNKNQTDMRLYALVFLLILIGGLTYYMLKKRSKQEFKTLNEEDKD